MAEVPIPNDAASYDEWKHSAAYLEEQMSCSTYLNGLRKLVQQLERGLVASEDVEHILCDLIHTVTLESEQA